MFLGNLKYVSYFISCRPFKAMYAIYSQMACCNANCCNSGNLPLFMTLCCRRKTYFANCLFHTVAKFSFYEGKYFGLVCMTLTLLSNYIYNQALAILAVVGFHFFPWESLITWLSKCPPSLGLGKGNVKVVHCLSNSVWEILSFRRRDSHSFGLCSKSLVGAVCQLY